MSTIGSNNTNAATGVDQSAAMQQVEYFDESVKRGYDTKTTQSRNDDIQDAKAETQHRLEQPSPPKTRLDTLKTLRESMAETGVVSAEDIANANQEFSPYAKETKNRAKQTLSLQYAESLKGRPLNNDESSTFVKYTAPPGEDSKGPTMSPPKEGGPKGETGGPEGHHGHRGPHGPGGDQGPHGADGHFGPHGPHGNSGIDGDGQRLGQQDATWDDVWASARAAEPPFTDKEIKGLQAAQDNHELMFGENQVLDTLSKAANIRTDTVPPPDPAVIQAINNDVKKLQALLGSDLWDTDEIASIVSGIQEKMQKNRLKFDQESIKANQIEKERMSKSAINDIRESIEKNEKAERSGLIGKIFMYIGLAVMAVITGLMIASGVGAPAAACMIAAMAIMVAMTIDGETGGHMMSGIAKGISEAFGCDEQTANWIATAVIMAIMIALTLGAGAGGGAAAGTSQAIVQATKVAQVIGAGCAIAEGGAQVAKGVYSYEASMLQADAKENKAAMQRLQQMIDDAVESLQMALEDLQAGQSAVAGMVSSNDDTKKALSKNLK